MVYDVAVIGGGPGGAAAAIRAAQLGCSSALFESDAAPSTRVGEMLPAAVDAVLRRLYSWDRFALNDPVPCAGRCAAWGDPELAWRDPLSPVRGGGHGRGRGWFVERARFDGLLRSAAVAAGVSVRMGEPVTGIRRGSDGTWRLVVANGGRSVGARFLVDASGRAGVVARRMGVRRVQADSLVALCAVVEAGRGVSEVAYSVVESAEEGWWQVARSSAGQAVVSLFTDSDLAAGMGSGVGVWHAWLSRTRHVAALLDRPPAPRHVSRIAAWSHCLEPAQGPGWVAVGDAAAARDPLVSAGTFDAMDSGIDAAEAAVGYLRGNPGVLDRYGRDVRERFSDHRTECLGRYALERRWPDSAFWKRRLRGKQGDGGSGHEQVSSQ